MYPTAPSAPFACSMSEGQLGVCLYQGEGGAQSTLSGKGDLGLPHQVVQFDLSNERFQSWPERCGTLQRQRKYGRRLGRRDSRATTLYRDLLRRASKPGLMIRL